MQVRIKGTIRLGSIGKKRRTRSRTISAMNIHISLYIPAHKKLTHMLFLRREQFHLILAGVLYMCESTHASRGWARGAMDPVDVDGSSFRVASRTRPVAWQHHVKLDRNRNLNGCAHRTTMAAIPTLCRNMSPRVRILSCMIFNCSSVSESLKAVPAFSESTM